MAFEHISRTLLGLHLLAAIVAAGAAVHLAVRGARRWRGESPLVRRERLHAKLLVISYTLTWVLGVLICPTFRVRVRAALLDPQMPWATGLFEAKEHLATIGQAYDRHIIQLAAGYRFKGPWGVLLTLPVIHRAWRRPDGLELDRGSQTGLGDASVTGQLVLSGETKGKDTFQGAKADDTAITGVSLGPKSAATLGERFSGELGFEVPVVQRNSALQAVANWRMDLSAAWRF